MNIFAERAIEFMKQNRNRPFFLYLPTNLVHVPLVVADDLAARYDDVGSNNSTVKIYGMIRSIDNNFGRLRAVLRELGLEDNTLFIFTSITALAPGSCRPTGSWPACTGSRPRVRKRHPRAVFPALAGRFKVRRRSIAWPPTLT